MSAPYAVGSLRVLVLDDEAPALDELSWLLRQDGRVADVHATDSPTEALRLLQEEPDAQLVAGATDWGVDANLRGAHAPLVIALERLPELRELVVGDDGIEIGAALMDEVVRLAVSAYAKA